jgi:hypothetical protein
MLASVVHVMAAVSFGFAPRSARKQRKGGELAVVSSGKMAFQGVGRVVRHLRRRLWREVTLCAEQEVDEYDVDASVLRLAVLGNFMVGCAGFVHIGLGIIVFSSLQFVSV